MSYETTKSGFCFSNIDGRQSCGWAVFIHPFIWWMTMSQTSMHLAVQLESPNLRWKCSTMRPENESQKRCRRGSLHSRECWLLVIVIVVSGVSCDLFSADRTAEARRSSDPSRWPWGPQPVADADRQARRRQHGEEGVDGSDLRAAYQQRKTVVKVTWYYY